MEKEFYLQSLKLIEEDYQIAKIKLYYEYALANAKFKVGDTIRDERHAFVIDKIVVSIINNDEPKPVYHGFELKKDLTPRKDKNRVCIRGNNAELINKK
jgi:hypothetical protein